MVPVAALNAALTRVETRDDDKHVTADEGRVERNNCMLSNYPFQTLCSRYIFIFWPQFLLSTVDDVTGSLLVHRTSCLSPEIARY